MALLCEYFVADSDEAAAATIGWVGGPQKPPEAKGLFRRSRVDPIPTVNAPGIEPVVMMSTLGNLIRGLAAYSEEIPDDGAIVDSRDGGERLIYRLSNSVVAALAESEEAVRLGVAEPWSQTEEFFGLGDPSVLSPIIAQLVMMARQARTANKSMYCWLSV